MSDSTQSNIDTRPPLLKKISEIPGLYLCNGDQDGFLVEVDEKGQIWAMRGSGNRDEVLSDDGWKPDAATLQIFRLTKVE